MSAGGTRRPIRLALAALAAAALATLPAAGAPAAPGAVLRSLSNLRTVTRWAYPASEALIRAEPSARSRALGRLRFLTGDGQAQIYLALGSARLPTGQSWIQIEVPARPNGQRGWVPTSALEELHTVDGYLLVDRSTLRATLYRDGRVIFSAPIGVGKPGTITPPGHFYVVEKLVTLDDPVYGPFAIGTSAYAPTLSEWPGGGVVASTAPTNRS